MDDRMEQNHMSGCARHHRAAAGLREWPGLGKSLRWSSVIRYDIKSAVMAAVDRAGPIWPQPRS